MAEQKTEQPKTEQPKTEQPKTEQPLTKEHIVRGIVARISEGGAAALPNGMLRIVRSEVSGAGKYLWKDANRENADVLDSEVVVKRLVDRYKKTVLMDEIKVFPSIDEAADAITSRDDEVRERIGLKKKAVANLENKHQGKTSQKKEPRTPGVPRYVVNAEIFKSRREAKGLNLSQVYKQAGVKKDLAWHMEKKGRAVVMEDLVAIAEVLDCKPDDLKPVQP